MKDYIRLGLAIKARWPEIDFETVEICEVPFGRLFYLEIPILVEKIEESHRIIIDTEPALFEMESVKMFRFRSKQAEFMAGYTPISNKLLIGIKK